MEERVEFRGRTNANFDSPFTDSQLLFANYRNLGASLSVSLRVLTRFDVQVIEGHQWIPITDHASWKMRTNREE